MSETKYSKYYYMKRVKELQKENDVLRQYRRGMVGIFEALVKNGEDINWTWILQQFRYLLK